MHTIATKVTVNLRYSPEPLSQLLHLLAVGSFFRMMSKASLMASNSFISHFSPVICRAIICGLGFQVVINRALMSGPCLAQGEGEERGAAPRSPGNWFTLLNYRCPADLLVSQARPTNSSVNRFQYACSVSVCDTESNPHWSWLVLHGLWD